MSASEIAARLTSALEAAAAREAENAALVSVTIELLGSCALGQIEARLVRKTRTLLFMTADLTAEDGALRATASSVHKIA